MDPQACVAAFGEAVGPVCWRAVALGWSATDGAGWLSGLAAVIAGFIFAAIVMVLAPQGERRADGLAHRIEVGDSLPVLIGAFLSLLVGALLLVLVSAQFHPLRIGPAAGLATAVFAAGVVQTFVAVAWLFLVSPRTVSSFGSVKLVVRFVMFAAAVLLHTTVWKGYTISSGEDWDRVTMTLSVAVLIGPWLASRAVLRSRSLVERYNGRFQVFTTRCTVAFLGLAVAGMVYVLDRRGLTPADAFPAWLATGILLASGLLFAVYDMNLPPQRETPAPVREPATTSARPAHEPALA